LKITAVNDEGLVMALRHVRNDVRGVQFHPESIMTPEIPLCRRQANTQQWWTIQPPYAIMCAE